MVSPDNSHPAWIGDGAERRLATGLARWVVRSRLPTGAPLWLRLRRAMPLRLTPFVNQPDK